MTDTRSSLVALLESYPDDSAEASICTTLLDCLGRHGLDETVYQARLLRRWRNPRTNAVVASVLGILAPDGVPTIEASDADVEAALLRTIELDRELRELSGRLGRILTDAAIAKAESELA